MFELKIIIFIYSKYCIDGINVSIWKWIQKTWNREDKLSHNSDIWWIMYRSLTSVKNTGITILFKQISRYQYTLEYTSDRMAKTTMERAHKTVSRTVIPINQSVTCAHRNNSPRSYTWIQCNSARSNTRLHRSYIWIIHHYWYRTGKERVLVYMTPLAYENVTFWCVRKSVLVIKNQKVIQKKHLETI